MNIPKNKNTQSNLRWKNVIKVFFKISIIETSWIPVFEGNNEEELRKTQANITYIFILC